MSIDAQVMTRWWGITCLDIVHCVQKVANLLLDNQLLPHKVYTHVVVVVVVVVSAENIRDETPIILHNLKNTIQPYRVSTNI
jgi:hypothetical protein